MPTQSGTHHTPAIATQSLVGAACGARHSAWERQTVGDTAGDAAVARSNSVFPHTTAV